MCFVWGSMSLWRVFLISHLQGSLTSEGSCLRRQHAARQFTRFWNWANVWFSLALQPDSEWRGGQSEKASEVLQRCLLFTYSLEVQQSLYVSAFTLEIILSIKLFTTLKMGHDLLKILPTHISSTFHTMGDESFLRCIQQQSKDGFD